MAKKKPRKRGKKAPLPQQLQNRLAEAENLIRRNKFAEADILLRTLDRQNPRQREILALRGNLYQMTQDYRSLLDVCEQMVELAPNSPDLLLTLARVLLSNIRPALAVQAFQRFLERWPDHAESAEVRREIPILTEMISRELSGLQGAAAPLLELAALHERIGVELELGHYAAVEPLAEKLASLCPRFAPVFNNWAEACFRQGKVEQALAHEQRVLELTPDNIHALSNLTRYLLLSGRVEEARASAQRLRAVPATVTDHLVKKAEAFSFLGDDQAILDVWKDQSRLGASGQRQDALLAHLVAVAHYRLGKEAEARKLWREALNQAPSLTFARDNLADLEKPPAERNAPWAFTLDYWLPGNLHKELGTILAAAGDNSADILQRFLDRYPQLPALAPLLLDRGDPVGREFILGLAKSSKSPQMLAALRDFALGQWGPDKLRHQAAIAASEAGLLSGPVRMWLQGQWREIQLLGWEIITEPIEKYPPPVTNLMSQAWEALQNDDGVRGEQLLRKALALQPEAPEILNNLSVAYKLQGRTQEAEELVDRIHRQHPDYSFARINLAFRLLSEGKPEEAAEMMMPVMKKRQLHRSELISLCQAQIEVCLARKMPEGVQRWVEIWQDFDPENPDLQRYLLLANLATLKDSLGKRTRRRRK